ncbi:CsxC family protein [Bacillus toyonensis]|uniref:Uracil permease n=1 Tax=Bacillus toyonensis TaxID=155322 RepID=A0A2C4QUR5_9BACI|nr:Uracil permease [Bacillus toyonensis]PGB03785.1 Uracil permease [Bacillus toyonensis]PHD68138.1 Uracil permease [Bacillus toyonensis]
MTNQEDYYSNDHNKDCKVKSETQTPFSDTAAAPVLTNNPIVKIPVVLAERTLQIVVEANIPLCPPAVEIKRVLKDVFLQQCKLVPVEYEPIDETGYWRVTRAKLFVEGFIRKNIEYAAKDCNGVIHDKIAKVRFSGFADLTRNDFLSFPTLAFTSENKARFINPKNTDIPRLDKFFFENNVFYNEQPYCELISAEFYELDFSPCDHDDSSNDYGHDDSCNTHNEKEFDKLREKIVLDLTLKVLQTQQVRVGGSGQSRC